MNITQETSLVINAISWTILHSLWQGLLLYSVLQIVLKIIPDSKANMRYNISIATFSLLILWIGNTFIHQLGQIGQYVINANQSSDINTSSTLGASEITHHNYPFTLQSFINSNTDIIVMIYLLGITFSIVRMGYNIYKVNTLKTSGVASTTFQDLLLRYKTQMNIRQNVAFILSEKIEIPMVIGTLKPIILFPIATLNHLSIEEAETILVHELAHIKRNDYLVNMIQLVFETILFYNPFIWLISKNIRIEREFCCDDIVTKETNTNIEYANALAQLSQMQEYGYASLALTGKKYKLLNRIKRIVEMKKTPISRMQLIAVTSMFIAIFMSATIISPDLWAQSKSDDDDTNTKKAQKTTVHIIEEKVTIIDNNGDTTQYSSIDDVPQKDRKIFHSNNMNFQFGQNKKVVVQKGDSFMVKMVIDITDDNNDSVCIAPDVYGDRQVLIDSIIKIKNNAIVLAKKQINDAQTQIQLSGDVIIDLQKELHDLDININELAELSDSMKNKVIVIERVYTDTDGNMSKRASNSSSGYKNAITKLDDNGLIDNNAGYSIIIKDNDLTINGKKQPTSYIKKYFPNYEAGDNVIIKGSKGNMKIKIER